MNTEHEGRRKFPVPSDRAIRLMVAALVLLFVAFMVLVGARLYVMSRNDQEQSEQIGELRGANAAQDEALKEANRRLTEAGQPPVAVPSAGPTGAAGEPGAQGPAGPAPSAAEVLQAVSAFCAGDRCTGPAGADGQDGRSPTRAEVISAVSTYCDARGECRGPAGQDGADGKDGQDAPPPTDNQVQQAVATYCNAHDDCRGPAGPAGADGQDATCSGEFVCESELAAILADYAKTSSVLDLIRALGCQVDVVDGPPNAVFTCTITGKP